MGNDNSCEFFAIYKDDPITMALLVQYQDGRRYDLTAVTEIQARFKGGDGNAVVKTLTTGEGPLVGGVTVTTATDGAISVALSSEDVRGMKTGERDDFVVRLFKGIRAFYAVNDGLILKAIEPGLRFNGIKLTCDGIATIDAIVAAYNDTVSQHDELYLTAEGSEVVPPEGVITLAGGTDEEIKTVVYSRAISVRTPPV